MSTSSATTPPTSTASGPPTSTPKAAAPGTSQRFNGLYEFNGDYDLRYSTGLMYEGWRWAFEAMIQLPVYDHLDDRPELDFGFGIGLRLSF